MKDLVIRCPKCNSQRVDLDYARGYGVTSPYKIEVLHCSNCGKQLYGAEAISAVEKQRQAWLNLLAQEARETEARITREAEERRLQETLETQRLQEAQEALLQQSLQVPTEPDWSQIPCAWKDCSHLRRENSIYCSTDCSNKNARWRYALKKGTLKVKSEVPTRPCPEP